MPHSRPSAKTRWFWQQVFKHRLLEENKTCLKEMEIVVCEGNLTNVDIDEE
jgi:hypothetical protein